MLCTVHVNAKDFEPSGTAPADGDTVTEIAGPTSSGFETMSDARNALAGLDRLLDVKRHSIVSERRARTASG